MTETVKLDPLEELRKVFPAADPWWPGGGQAWLGDFTLVLTDFNSLTEWDLGIYTDEQLESGEPPALLLVKPAEAENVLRVLSILAARPTLERLVKVYCRIVRGNVTDDYNAVTEVCTYDNRHEVLGELSDVLGYLGWDFEEDENERDVVVVDAYPLVLKELLA